MDRRSQIIIGTEKRIYSLLRIERLKKFLIKHNIEMLYEQDPKEIVPSYQETLNSTQYSVVKTPSQSWKIRYRFKKSSGNTEIKLQRQYDENKPSVIFHHGLGAMSFRFQFQVVKEIFPENKYNIFIIMASHHDSLKNVIGQFINNFTNLTAGIVGSTLAIEEVISFHKSLSSKPIIVTGFSLGGVITGLHYFYFNTADYYFPIISFPDASQIILNKHNRDYVKNYEKLKKNESFKKCFLIPNNLRKKPKNKIFPIIGKYDDIVNFKKAKKFWKDYDFKILETGHITVISERKELKNFILSKLS